MNRIAVIAAAGLLSASGLGLSAAASPRIQETPGGSYSQSCSNAYVNQGRLYAQCLDTRGQRFSTSIEVAPCTASDIGNDDGLLICHGTRGRRENTGGGGNSGGGANGGGNNNGGNNGGGWGGGNNGGNNGGGWGGGNNGGNSGGGWGGGNNGGNNGGGWGGGSRGPLVDYNLPPQFGTHSFYGGYYNDPLTVRGYSGGGIRASDVAQACQGYVSRAPDMKITYNGSLRSLIFSVASDSDTTLLINGPDGRWYCDDDSGNYGLNPMLRFDRPMTGTYDVWIGSYDRDRNDAATLYVSERTSQ